MEESVSSKAAIFVLLCVFVSSSGFAGTAGNLVNFPEANKFSIGFEYIDVEQRDIYEYDNEASCVMKDVQRRLGRVSYGLLPRVALDLWYGKADCAFGTEEAYKKDEALTFDFGSIWGLGIRTRLFEDKEKGLSAGAGFQYYRYLPDPHFRRSSRRFFCVEPEEWQLSFDLAKELNKYIGLYGALRYSELFIPYTHPNSANQTRIGGFEAEDNVGVAVGIKITFLENILLCLEKRLVDEESFIFSAGYKW
jgi:hypothetical protein